MSTETKAHALARLRRRYASAGPQDQAQILDRMAELPAHHREVAFHALAPDRPCSSAAATRTRAASFATA